MKQKALALIVSLAMLVTICVPGTFAVEAAGQSVCEKTEHTHTDACYTKSETPSCGLELGAGAHTHSESCYEQRQELTCTLAEDETHTHSEGCYTTQSVLVCTQEESAGHTHDDSCYAKELTCTLEEHTHDESCYQAATTENNEETKQPESAQPVCNCTPVDGVHAETCPLYQVPTQPEKKECTCGAVAGEDGTIVHAEDCPLYQVPVQPEKKECTCGAVAGEDGTIIHAEDCPLYVAPVVPEKPAHIEGCVDGCTVEGCTCPCHELSLFERLMACETLWDLYTLAEATPEEELLALTEEENAKIEAKIEALEPAPLPPVGEGTADVPADEPVISEIIYPTVNFDNVAPFGAPVEG